MVYYDFQTKVLHGSEPTPIYNPHASLGSIILHHLNKFPENVMQVCADDEREMICGELAKLMTNFAKNMLKQNFKQGDVVGIVGRNSTFITPVIFGCFLIATPISPVDSRWNDFSITFELTEPKIIFCDHNVAHKIKNYVDKKEKKVEIVVMTDKVEGFRHVSEFFEDVGGVKM